MENFLHIKLYFEMNQLIRVIFLGGGGFITLPKKRTRFLFLGIFGEIFRKQKILAKGVRDFRGVKYPSHFLADSWPTLGMDMGLQSENDCERS